MKKEKRKTSQYDSREYWLNINYYRWEFLRRSDKYRDFYKRVKKEYLKPLEKFEADLKEGKLAHRQIFAGRFRSIGPPDLVKQLRYLEDKKFAFRGEAYNKFALSWFLVEKHYPKEMLNPNKTISKDAIVFADYQQYDSSYKDLVFHPHIKRITNMPYSDFKRFRELNPTHEIFAISTWGENDISNESMQVIVEIIKETFKNKVKKSVIKNLFLLDPCKPMRGKTLKLQAKKLSEHWDKFLNTLDLFIEERKNNTYENAIAEISDQLKEKEDTVRSRVKEARKLISETSQGRFYILNKDNS